MNHVQGRVRVQPFHVGLLNFVKQCGHVLIMILCICAPSAVSSVYAADKAVPMGGRCETTFAFTGPTTSDYEGTCNLLHLGLTHVVAAQMVTFNPDGTLHIVDVAIYTSANGDELHGHFDGIGTFISSTEVSFVGTETYKGGTGRFADASGSAVLTGVAMFTSPNGGIGEYVGKGTLSY